MTDLTIKELKAICIERNITVTGDKRLKTSYINAIETANAPNFEAMTEAECEVWMEEATGIKIGTVATSETKATAEVEIMAEAVEKMLETIGDRYVEQATGIDIPKAPVATSPRSALTVILVPIIMVIAAVGLAILSVRVLVPLLNQLYAATAGVVRSIATPQSSRSIDYFPNAQPAS